MNSSRDALEPGRHHPPVLVPDGAESVPHARVAPQRPVLDQVADGEAVLAVVSHVSFLAVRRAGAIADDPAIRHPEERVMARLAGRTAIVTGGAKGIGAHYCEALAAEGAAVVIADIADGKEVAEKIAARHGAQLDPQRYLRCQRRDPGEGAGRAHHRALRQDRHAGQQRRAVRAAAVPAGHRDRCRALGQGDGGECARAVPDGQARRAAHEGAQIRQDHQYRLGHGL